MSWNRCCDVGADEDDRARPRPRGPRRRRGSAPARRSRGRPRPRCAGPWGSVAPAASTYTPDRQVVGRGRTRGTSRPDAAASRAGSASSKASTARSLAPADGPTGRRVHSGDGRRRRSARLPSRCVAPGRVLAGSAVSRSDPDRRPPHRLRRARPDPVRHPPRAGRPGSAEPARPSISTTSPSRCEPFVTVPGGPLAIAAPEDGSGRLFVVEPGRPGLGRRPDGASLPDPAARPPRPARTAAASRACSASRSTRTSRPIRGSFVDYTDAQRRHAWSRACTLDPNDPNRLDPAAGAEILVRRPAVREPQRRRARSSGPTATCTSRSATAAAAATRRATARTSTRCSARSCASTSTTGTRRRPYGVPPDNPFADGGGAGEIWLYGPAQPVADVASTGRPATCGSATSARTPGRRSTSRAAGVGGPELRLEPDGGQPLLQARAGLRPTGLTPAGRRVRPRPGLHGHRRLRLPRARSTRRSRRVPVRRLLHRAGSSRSTRRRIGWIAPVTVAQRSGGRISAFGEDAAGELYLVALDGSVSRIVAARGSRPGGGVGRAGRRDRAADRPQVEREDDRRGRSGTRRAS